MTLDIEKLAREAGIDQTISREPVWIATQEDLERFAALVLEQAAQKCEGFAVNADGYIDDDWAAMCSEAIRAMKPKAV